MPARRLRRRLAVGVAVFTGYLLGAVAVTAGAWRGPATGWAGGCCDQEPAIWYLGWVPHALAHGLDPFFTTQIGAPAGVNLMWNPSMPLLGVLSWLPTRIGGPVFGFNVAMTAGIALSALTAWLAIRRWTGDGAGPIVGGAVYGFSPFVVSHAALHLNLASAWVVPLLLIAVDEMLVTRRHPPRRAGAVLGALAAAQLLISEEVLATGVVAAAVWLGVLAAAGRIRPPTAAVGAGLATAMATFLLLAGWPLLAQFRGPQRLTRPVQDPTVFSTDLLNLVVPTPYQLVAPGTGPGFSGLTHEATAYLGVPLLLVVIAAMIRFRDDPRIRVAGPTGAALFVLSLGPWLHVGTRRLPVPLPWWPLQKLPLLEHALPGRLTVYVWLSVAFVVGVVVARARHLARPQAAPWLSAIAAGLLVVLPAPLPRAPFSTPAFFRNWSTHHIAADETVLVAPYFVNGSEAAPMVWAAQTRYRLRTPEAYAYVPQPGGGTYSGPAQSQLTYTMYTIQQSGRWLVARGGIRTQIADDLADADIRHVIVGPTLNWQPLVGFFTDLFGRPPNLTDGVAIWRDVNARGVAPAPSH